jgi:hypothetical protein
VLVATTIMAVAVGTLLAAMSNSLRNASRMLDSDRGAVLARRTMDELIAAPPIAYDQVLQGVYDVRESGIPAGWRARVEPFETVPGGPPDRATIERILLEVWWNRGAQRRSLVLEGFRPAPPRRSP